jgi:hypothetical protein
MTVLSDTRITVKSPVHTAGVVDITVITPRGTSVTSSADQFTYIPLPTVTGITPSSGPQAGGTTVTITGTGFTGATGVRFGTTPGTAVTVVSDTTITVQSPARTAGIADVTVTTPGGTSAVVAGDRFTYVPAPAVTGITPASGSLAGGTVVTITGTGFAGATAVTFGETAGTGLTVVSASTITVKSPAHASGIVDVRVTTPSGTSTIVTGDRFTYAPAPAVTGIAPSSGPVAGGTVVTITGTGFTGATGVRFGTTAGTTLTVVSDTTITVRSPAHIAGVVDVTVITPRGTSVTSSADQFTYAPIPTVTGITPASGPQAGGTTVTITGTGFTGATGVRFGTTAGTSLTVTDATHIVITSPARTAGIVDVTVITPGGTSAIVYGDRFTYVPAPAVTSITPASGSVAGGTVVTIYGTGFTSATAVTFGETAGTGLTVVYANMIKVKSPAHAAGIVDVRVTTPGGTSTIVALDKFTYT